MKTVVSLTVRVRAIILLAICACSWIPASLHAQPQINSWTNSTSGNWEDAHWSLGELPGTNQDILFTNAGWKALAIDPSTAQNFPGTLSVDSITISSPTNSFNTLLLNYAGTQSPLTVRSLTLASNSAITMLSSALWLNGPNSVGMQIGGEFNQNDSVVSGRQVNVGYIGPGIYNLNSGLIAVSNLWVGGVFGGIFNQTGGTNNTQIIGLDPGGTYNLSGGDFAALVYFNDDDNPPILHQTGGRITRQLTIFRGTYQFDAGMNYGGVVDPVGSGLSYSTGNALVIQTGGTNFGELDLGSNGFGNYILSNGCSFAPALNIGTFGTFHQFGGTQIITNALYLGPDFIDYSFRGDGLIAGGSYSLSGGTLMTGGMTIFYDYTQDGGTNLVAGDIAITNQEPVVFAGLRLNGGLLKADNITSTFGGVLQQTGGCLIVNNLTAQGEEPPAMASFGPDINCLGGELVVSNIDVEMDYCRISGTIVKQTGTLTLGGIGTLLPGPGSYTFGPLNPKGGVIVLETNVNCQIHFGDSSSQEGGSLIIRNWSGSIYGGGSQQIIFGSNAAGLRAEQLGGILFENPAGKLPPSPFIEGSYFARILPTGEIVPDTGAPLPPMINLSSSNGTMQLTLGGDIGQTYGIDISTDLVHWLTWTSQLNTNGTISIEDDSCAGFPQRFYRAHAMP